MSTLRILGYANSKAATIVVDRASPQSQVSAAAFLFNNDLNSSFDSTGCEFACLAILVPLEGGYYTSSSLRLQSSTTCIADVVLGARGLAGSVPDQDQEHHIATAGTRECDGTP